MSIDFRDFRAFVVKAPTMQTNISYLTLFLYKFQLLTNLNLLLSTDPDIRTNEQCSQHPSSLI